MNHLKNKIARVVKKTELVAPSTNPLLNGMYAATSRGTTQNGAATFTRSGSNLLDFYSQAGAMRSNPKGALDLFKAAFSEDNLKAIRILFYLRDVRGGQGERTLFRTCLEWLGTDFPEVFEKIVGYVQEYGRWDDIFFDHPAVFKLLNEQLKKDIESDSPSLLAKWLPTANASSPTTRAKARYMASELGLDTISYRRTIRALRKRIAAVEELMSANQWKKIAYSGVPSQAVRIYKDAFLRHDPERYAEFIEKAQKGEVKINAATLYPYQLYKDAHLNYSPTLEALWSQLPDYTRGKNALVVADVSGSMAGDPIAVSVSLALYFAERNTGIFKDHFITFSANPILQRVVGKKLLEKINSIKRQDWDMNTNLEAVFRLILDTAVRNSVPPEQMPETLYIISDMEFDECVAGQTLHDNLKQRYEDAGYTPPNVVFWNVHARTGSNLPVQKDERNVAMVSGFSPVIFKMAVENKTPEQVMLDTINAERYSSITL